MALWSPWVFSVNCLLGARVLAHNCKNWWPGWHLSRYVETFSYLFPQNCMHISPKIKTGFCVTRYSLLTVQICIPVSKNRFRHAGTFALAPTGSGSPQKLRQIFDCFAWIPSSTLLIPITQVSPVFMVIHEQTIVLDFTTSSALVVAKI